MMSHGMGHGIHASAGTSEAEHVWDHMSDNSRRKRSEIGVADPSSGPICSQTRSLDLPAVWLTSTSTLEVEIKIDIIFQEKAPEACGY